MLFQRRTRHVTAWQVNAQDWDSCTLIATWCGGDVLEIDDFLAMQDLGVIWLPGPHGLGDYAEDGDWIVQLENSTFHVFVPAVFEAIFEPAEGQ